ncbi:hypothetical protein PV04_06823 [Phialophora macrospora]|uniref:Apple domain-containing protein n=1 Tax=Phialophora macrospora TaxID=1851006 RepID=A0A0D2FLJ5_9EURO|nr:hypothetical protein PV04_06823 [Phialophora macrospora]
MDGLQVASPLHDKHVVSGPGSDKFPLSGPSTNSYLSSPAYTNPPSTTSSQPIGSGHRQEPVQAQAPLSSIHDEKSTIPPDTRYRTPFGLSVIAYTALVSAIVLVICGAAFGGAIAAVAGNQDDDCSSSSGDNAALGAESGQATATATVATTVFATITATGTGTGTGTATSTPSGEASLLANYAPVDPSQISTAALNCTTGSSIYTLKGSQFQLNCNTNYAGNDIAFITAYRLEDCVGACENLNTLTTESTTPCMGVVFNANMHSLVPQNGGNCWLKSAMKDARSDVLPPSVGAVLVATT